MSLCVKGSCVINCIVAHAHLRQQGEEFSGEVLRAPHLLHCGGIQSVHGQIELFVSSDIVPAHHLDADPLSQRMMIWGIQLFYSM